MALLAEKICGINPFSLVEHRGIGCVQILWKLLAKRAAAESNDILIHIDNGKDGPVAEHVKVPGGASAFLRGFDKGQAYRGKLIQRITGRQKMVGQGGPLIRSRAKAELPDHGIGEPAVPEILKGAGTCGLKEHFMIEAGGFLIGLQEAFTAGAPLLPLRVVNHFGKRYMGAVSKQFHCFVKTAMLHFHNKSDYIPTGLAAKTIIKLLFRIDGKGSGFFSVEGAKPPELPAGFLQRNITGYNLYDIRPGTQVVQPGSGKTGSHKKHTSANQSPRSESREGRRRKQSGKPAGRIPVGHAGKEIADAALCPVFITDHHKLLRHLSGMLAIVFEQVAENIVAAGFLRVAPAVAVDALEHEFTQAVHGAFHSGTHVQMRLPVAVGDNVRNHGIDPFTMGETQNGETVAGNLVRPENSAAHCIIQIVV